MRGRIVVGEQTGQIVEGRDIVGIELEAMLIGVVGPIGEGLGGAGLIDESGGEQRGDLIAALELIEPGHDGLDGRQRIGFVVVADVHLRQGELGADPVLGIRGHVRDGLGKADHGDQVLGDLIDGRRIVGGVCGGEGGPMIGGGGVGGAEILFGVAAIEQSPPGCPHPRIKTPHCIDDILKLLGLKHQRQMTFPNGGVMRGESEGLVALVHGAGEVVQIRHEYRFALENVGIAVERRRGVDLLKEMESLRFLRVRRGAIQLDEFHAPVCRRD